MDGGLDQTFFQRMRSYLKQRKHLFSTVKQRSFECVYAVSVCLITKTKSVKKHTHFSAVLLDIIMAVTQKNISWCNTTTSAVAVDWDRYGLALLLVCVYLCHCVLSLRRCEYNHPKLICLCILADETD